MKLDMKWTYALAESRFLLPETEGDFGLSFVELVEPIDTEDENMLIDPLYVRIAAVHVHIASRWRAVTIADDAFDQMIMLQEDPYGGVEASCLALLKEIIPDPPAWMANKELAFVDVVRQRANEEYVAHVSPVTLHLAGKFWKAEPMFDDFSQWLPIRSFPKKPHMCRLQRQQQRLWDQSQDPCLKEEEVLSTTEEVGNQAYGE
jgi:hypothetical protein